jgi:hypothetical protein
MQDREQVESGKIPLKCLFTIREGEPAFDNVMGSITRAATDIIKIKGTGENDATCRFLDQEQVGCRIYEMRPIECRLLTCWDTQVIQAFYDKDRLTRNDLLSRLPGLHDLVNEHQVRCGYARVGQLADRILQNQGPLQEAVAELSAIIHYDQSLRQVTVERARLDPEMLDFLFGRPLSSTIRRFNITMVENELDRKRVLVAERISTIPAAD